MILRLEVARAEILLTTVILLLIVRAFLPRSVAASSPKAQPALVLAASHVGPVDGAQEEALDVAVADDHEEGQTEIRGGG